MPNDPQRTSIRPIGLLHVPMRKFFALPPMEIHSKNAHDVLLFRYHQETHLLRVSEAVIVVVLVVVVVHG